MAREDEPSSELGKRGLATHEARCYVFLVKLGPSDPRKVSARFMQFLELPWGAG